MLLPQIGHTLPTEAVGPKPSYFCVAVTFATFGPLVKLAIKVWSTCAYRPPSVKVYRQSSKQVSTRQGQLSLVNTLDPSRKFNEAMFTFASAVRSPVPTAELLVRCKEPVN